jgi:monolysocardiolipin acyltransferase
MPEGRPFPQKYFPRPETRLSITFGEPIPVEQLKDAISLKTTEKDARIRVTSLVHDHVENLWRTVSGKLLAQPE